MALSIILKRSFRYNAHQYLHTRLCTVSHLIPSFSATKHSPRAQQSSFFVIVSQTPSSDPRSNPVPLIAPLAIELHIFDTLMLKFQRSKAFLLPLTALSSSTIPTALSPVSLIKTALFFLHHLGKQSTGARAAIYRHFRACGSRVGFR
jgi:hypothetical protein